MVREGLNEYLRCGGGEAKSAQKIWAPLSSKFKRVSLKETHEFPFWGLNICVDFDIRDSKKMENIN